METTHPTTGASYPWRIYSSPFHCISHTRFGAKTIQTGEQSLPVPWKNVHGTISLLTWVHW